jgi:hypothetical protein
MKRLLPVILVILFAIIFENRVTLANWYAGNIHNTGYGAKANIYTPPSPVFLVQSGQSGESSWVSTAGSGNWIQTGWHYYWYYDPQKPLSYVESVASGEHVLYDISSHEWGTEKEYLVYYEHNSAYQWCALIDGQPTHCRILVHAPPVQLQFLSEVHNYPQNEIDTMFTNASFQDSSGSWHLLYQNNWVENFPYGVYKYHPHRYQTYRNITHELYMPFIQR